MAQNNTYRAVAADSAVDWDHPLNRGSVAWWVAPPGIAAAGSRMLDLCGRNHGTLINGPIWTPTGRGDSGLRLDGSDDYVACGTGNALQALNGSSFTAALWFRIEADVSMFILGTKGQTSDRAIGYRWGGAFINLGEENINFGVQIPFSFAKYQGRWARIAWTHSAGFHSCYIDGLLVGSGSFTFSANQSAAVKWGNGSSGAFGTNGFIADMRILNRAWTRDEAALDYNASRQGYCTPDSPLRWVRGVRYFTPLSAGPQTPFFPSMAGLGWC